MSTLKESIGNVRLLLDNPFEQKPTVRQILGSLLREFQTYYNELANSNVAWTVKETSLTLNGQADQLINSDVGKVLFVTAENGDYPVGVDFTDLQDASTYWWYENPTSAGRLEDYRIAPFQIAFYRKNGSLYARVPKNYSGQTLTITTSTGNWTKDADLQKSATLEQYHALPEIRAAMNLSHVARWTNDEQRDMAHSDRLMQSLIVQEQRVYQQFVQAKKSLTADSVCFIETADGYF